MKEVILGLLQRVEDLGREMWSKKEWVEAKQRKRENNRQREL